MISLQDFQKRNRRKIKDKSTKRKSIGKCCCWCPLRESSIIIVTSELIFVIWYWVDWFYHKTARYESRNSLHPILLPITVCIPLIGLAGISLRTLIGVDCYVFYSIFRIIIVGTFLLFGFIYSLSNPRKADIFFDEYVWEICHPNQKFILLGAIAFTWVLEIHFTMVICSYSKIMKIEYLEENHASVKWHRTYGEERYDADYSTDADENSKDDAEDFV